MSRVELIGKGFSLIPHSQDRRVPALSCNSPKRQDQVPAGGGYGNGIFEMLRRRVSNVFTEK